MLKRNITPFDDMIYRTFAAYQYRYLHGKTDGKKMFFLRPGGK